jgi:hypothetical protein
MKLQRLGISRVICGGNLQCVALVPVTSLMYESGGTVHANPAWVSHIIHRGNEADNAATSPSTVRAAHL